LEAGTLSVAEDASLGAAGGPLTFDGGMLATTAAFTTTRAVTLAADGTVRTDAALTLAGPVGGAGGLVKTGADRLVLAGANTYSGGTAIRAGTLQVGDGGTSGSIVGDVVDDGALVFMRSDAATFAGTITGAGT